MDPRSVASRSLVALATAAVLVASTALTNAGPGSGATAAASSPPQTTTDEAVLFASDGMRPDLVDKYVDQGVMPTMGRLISDGVKGNNGLLQGFPPNTGVGWSTLATGTWPAEHGSTNNTFHRTGEGNFNNSTSFSGTGIVQADHIGQAAERAGKSVVFENGIVVRIE